MAGLAAQVLGPVTEPLLDVYRRCPVIATVAHKSCRRNQCAFLFLHQKGQISQTYDPIHHDVVPRMGRMAHVHVLQDGGLAGCKYVQHCGGN